MRECSVRHPTYPQATDDPGMHGVAYGLRELYGGLTTAELPEHWKRKADEIEQRLFEAGFAERD